MSAQPTDKITYVALGTKTELASPGYNIGDSTINGNDLSQWNTDRGVYFGMDIVGSDGKRISNTYTEWFGIVTGGSIGSMNLINGTDQDYPAGATTRVYQLVTAAWANGIAEALDLEHHPDGAHSDVTADSLAVAGELTAGSGAVAGDLEVDGGLTVGGEAVSPMPSGVMLAYGGPSAPTGWLLCDGSAVSRTTYADLFAAIGTSYGTGNGSTTFNVPNGKGRSMFGVDSGQAEFSALGATGGQKTVQQHNHGVTDPGHNHALWSIGQEANVYTLGGSSNRAILKGGSPNSGDGVTGTRTTGVSVDNAGSGSNNLNPYLTANFIIKT